MKSKILTLINSIKKSFPIDCRYMAVDHLFNRGYTRLQICRNINPIILKAAIKAEAQIAGLRCNFDHEAGSIYMKVEFEKA